LAITAPDATAAMRKPVPMPVSPEATAALLSTAANAANAVLALGADGDLQRWLVWRRRGLVLAALLGCLAAFLLARWLASTPFIDAHWQRGPAGELMFQSSQSPTLQGSGGRTVVAMRAAGQTEVTVDAQWLHRAPRWQIHDDARRLQAQQWHDIGQVIAASAAAGRIELRLDTGEWVSANVVARNYAGLGLAFWPLLGMALLLYLYAAVLLMAQAQARSLPLALMSWCQAVNLIALALETAPGTPMGLGMAAAGAGLDPHGIGATAAAWLVDLKVRLALELCMGACAVHVFTLHPRTISHAKRWATWGWGVLALWLLLMPGHAWPSTWWWGQAALIVQILLCLVIVTQSYRLEANPYAQVMQRFAGIALVVFLIASGIAVLAATLPGLAGGEPQLALTASVLWHALLTTLLMLTPFLARSRQLLREFATLAGISTVATSLDLLFVAVFALGPFTSLAVAVFIALGLYAALRQRLVDRLIGSSMLTTERTFDHIYRAAREVQAQPTQYVQRLAQLLRDVFEPLEVLRVERQPPQTIVTGGGSALLVPLLGSGRVAERGAASSADDGSDDETPADNGMPITLALRFAQHGQRLFTLDDARLADRVVEQLRRAVAYDHAVEKGRHEERQRIAQDLHDDIGARLLTLMYQSTKPEMEDYIRHTLQDLKTLTRGLAANDHQLSHAAGEWKVDLTQRLSAAQANLGWSFSQDREVRLSMGQWSAITRVLRELVSNCLYHGHATRVDVAFNLHGTLLQLTVSDNGAGRQPQAWAHGLGLGGVRKRVKALGGTVVWKENEPIGIRCEVEVTDFIPLDEGPPGNGHRAT
jgi:signal transduction histidine kinase